jgi:hypothetical protein
MNAHRDATSRPRQHQQISGALEQSPREDSAPARTEKRISPATINSNLYIYIYLKQNSAFGARRKLVGTALRVVNCVIAAEPGHLLRLDFRDDFYIEPSEECRYDYLEVRDGAHGYSTLIGTYCGNEFPPMLTSSDRYLCVKFV